MKAQSMKPVIASLAVLLAASPAWSHALLKAATPAVGSTVASPPAAVAITFSEGVEPSFSAIAVTDAAGARVDSGAVHLGPGGNTELLADLKPLKPGSYAVAWHATSVDTHKTEGQYTFTVAP